MANEFDDLRTALVRLEDKIDAVYSECRHKLVDLASEVERLARRLDSFQAHVLARLLGPAEDVRPREGQ